MGCLVPITPPVTDQEVSTSLWGIPITNLVNTLEARTVTHYIATLGSVTSLPYGSRATLATINMPATPAGTKLDISWTSYMNSSVVGHQCGFLRAIVNGVELAPTTVIPDMVALASWSGRVVNVAAPTNVAYTVLLQADKGASGGTIAAQAAGNTNLCVVAYRP